MQTIPIMQDTHLITKYRALVGISQAAFAEKVGCKRSMMNLIEKGERRPSADLAGRIQEVTGIDARRLLGISSMDRENAA